MEVIIITRHKALIEYIYEEADKDDGHPLYFDLVDKAHEVLEHVANPDYIVGKHIVGVLPLHLAAKAASITEVPLNIPPEMRGKELSVDDLRAMAGDPVRYVVSTKSDHDDALANAWRNVLDK